MADRPLRILASAYTCEPHAGSEAGIGWNWVRQIASRHELWLITRENVVELVEAGAAEFGLSERLTVIGHDLPQWIRRFKRGPRNLYPYYYLWQMAMLPLARRWHARIKFDLAHHLTFATVWIPSALAFVSDDLPFVWGSVGSNEPVPQEFLEPYGLKVRAGEVAKGRVRRAMVKIDPIMRAMQRRAATILALNREVLRYVLPSEHHKVVLCPAMGCEPLDLPAGRYARHEPFRVLCVGRLMYIKQPLLAVQAFARFVERGAQARLDVVGSGPLNDVVAREVDKLGRDEIELHGNVPREQVLKMMMSADAFLFPSFEGAGMVVAEAMESGNPVVCLNAGGPGLWTDNSRGVVVGVSSYESAVRDIADGLWRLYSDEDERSRRAQAARAFADEIMVWDRRGEFIAEVYASALQHGRQT
ncbi:MAG: glycosyltransferase [Myxococcales bacterium]|nr:glycosyltransferase [Myxococcales bacterium]